ncbi:major facilitator superfamily domain-containing protein [Aspergillus pseudoustus]|uniref:Major facilitator superfamily domain-containing protein n=1 Tax=Aspergillus pseudoustus TaxID=1810923 RepID=A0ABR4J5J1_9EURO
MDSPQTLSQHTEVQSEKQLEEPLSEQRHEPKAEHKQHGLADFPDGGSRAWGVALGNSGVMFCTLGYINSWGVYQAYYQENQLHDQNQSAISWIGSLQTFFLFAASLVGGPLFDRYGAKVIYPPAVIYVFTIFMTSICKEYYQFMLCQGVLSGISSGLAMAPTMAATPQYFLKKRGAAMGLAVAGSSLGGVIFPIALNRMLTTTDLGFGWSVRIVAFLVLAILLVSCPPVRARLPPRKTNFLLPRAFKEPGYAALVIGAFFMFLGMFPPLFYIPSYGLSQGMTPTMAFYLSGTLNAASFPGRILPAIISDKFGRLNTFAGAGITTGILTLCWQRVSGSGGVIVFTALFGFFSGAIISGGTVTFASSASDPKNIGTYMGMGMAVISIAPLIGPPISGALVDTAMAFKAISIFAGMASLFGGLFTLFVVKIAGGKKLLSLE